MRIAYVVGAFPSRSETFIVREIEALEARGVTVEVFPLWRGGGAAAGSASGHPVQWCGGLPFWAPLGRPIAALRWKWYFLACLLREGRGALQALWNLSVAFAMGRRMRVLGVERVHAHFGNAPSTVAWVAASLAKVPFSFAVHARDVFVEGQFLAPKARAADRVVACSSAVAGRVADLVDAQDRPKIELIHHGLALDRYRFRAEAPGGEPVVLGVGRLVEKKGFLHLVRAMARLRQEGERLRCWLIGDGPQREPLVREIAELGLGDLVELKGWLPHEEVMAAYEQAAMLVAPSVVAWDGDMDGLPNVVVEAAAMGVPIVATDVGGLGDLVRDGETALVARAVEANDLAAKILEVLGDPGAAMERARRARKEVEARFDQAVVTTQLLDALGLSSPCADEP